MADRPSHLRSRALFYAAALLWLPAGVVATAVVRFGPTAVAPGEWPTAIAMAASSLIVAAVCGLPLAFACRRLGRMGHPRAAWIGGAVLGAATLQTLSHLGCAMIEILATRAASTPPHTCFTASSIACRPWQHG